MLIFLGGVVVGGVIVFVGVCAYVVWSFKDLW